MSTNDSIKDFIIQRSELLARDEKLRNGLFTKWAINYIQDFQNFSKINGEKIKTAVGYVSDPISGEQNLEIVKQTSFLLKGTKFVNSNFSVNNSEMDFFKEVRKNSELDKKITQTIKSLEIAEGLIGLSKLNEKMQILINFYKSEEYRRDYFIKKIDELIKIYPNFNEQILLNFDANSDVSFNERDFINLFSKYRYC